MNHSEYPIVLLIDNDPHARQLMRSAITLGDFYLLEAPTGALGLDLIERFRPALILTELDLPDIDGIEMIRQICSTRRAGPVLVVSGRASQDFIIGALDAGADDFVSKPFSAGELEARVRVAFRHFLLSRRELGDQIFRAGELEVDFRKRKVQVAGRNIHLTPVEYRILSFLINNADRVLTYNNLLQKIWKSKKPGHRHQVRVHMANLRRKLESDPANPSHLITQPRVGYQFHSMER